MGNYDFKPGELINAKERFNPRPKLQPKIDEVISKIVGRKILQQDPRLIKLVVKFKGNKSEDSKRPDNFLENPNFIKELKQVMNSSL